MADQGNPVDDMRNIVRSSALPDGNISRRTGSGDTGRMRAIGSPTDQRIGFASVRQALDEVEKRLQQTVLASEEVMRFHARPEPVNEAKVAHLPGDQPDATVWEDLATRAVLLSRAVETLERNLKITLETLR